MKFPKSVHAEGWANHIDTTKPEHLPDALKDRGSAPRVMPTMSTAIPVSPVVTATVPPIVSPAIPLSAPAAAPRVEARPAAARAQSTAVPPSREQQRNWMMVVGAGAAIVAALAVWAMNRPSEAPSTPPALVTGSVEPQTEVAAATPAPDTAAAAQPDSTPPKPSTTTASAEPKSAEPAPARLGLPVTTVRPAAESVAQAAVPAPRPDLVARANPRSPAPQPETRSSALQPLTIATAPANQPQALPPGSEPVTMPPTAAGPATATAPQPLAVTPLAVTPPLASATPDTAPLAQAAPTPEDSGITVKVRSALAADMTLAAVPIAVSTDHGVVKLEGQAPDAQTRERATVVAAGTTGVKAVDNRLTLRPPAVLSQAPSGL